MANRHGMDGPDGGGFAPRPSARDPLDARLEHPGESAYDAPEPLRPGGGNGADLRTLISRLGHDVSQLAHDEMTLAKLELRSVADTFSGEVRDATQTMVKDLAKVGVALSLATLAGLALTAGAIMAIGALLGGAYWAGGLIVGAVLLIAAVAFGMSAAKDLQKSESLRLKGTKRRIEQNRDVLEKEADASKRFVKHESKEFKRHASSSGASRSGGRDHGIRH